MTGLMLVAAMLLDAAFGEPKWLWDRAPHPAVIMGRAIGWLEARMNRGAARLMGMAMIALLVVAAGVVGAAIAALPLGWLWSVLLAAILLAQRSLVDHVADVARALRVGLAEGQASVAMIVGRDVSEMDEAAVARAAIESGAENFSDGIIAPAFWFLVAGLPGIVIYKVINTADSMVGYRNARFEAFGWASARLDDLVNWVPARLSAWLILLAHAQLRLWRVVRRDAGLHRSPNAGWPEAAMAAGLGVALSGPRSYGGEMRDYPFVYPEGARDIGADEIEASTRILWLSWAWGLAVVTVIGLLLI